MSTSSTPTSTSKTSLAARFSKLKEKADKYFPVLVVMAPTIIGAAGWVVAGVYAKRLEQAYAEDQDTWRSTIEVTPNVMKDVLAGATLQLRMFHTNEPNHTMVQMTSREDGFPAEADESYAKGTPGEAPRKSF